MRTVEGFPVREVTSIRVTQFDAAAGMVRYLISWEGANPMDYGGTLAELAAKCAPLPLPGTETVKYWTESDLVRHYTAQHNAPTYRAAASRAGIPLPI
jgi:hypothetical protein